MALEYKFLGRDKLLKGYTYPIKRGDLDAALERAGVPELRFIAFSCNPKHRSKGPFLSSRMLGEAQTSGGWAERSPYIIISAVPADISPRVKERIAEKDLLNNFAGWLKALEDAENVRRMKDQFYTATLIDGKLVVENT
ncbi:hypothetical protein DND132_2379 [Pseudodesulfovibrio mercurii]|uniref:Uncharacterized protein n=1 Tax=Pseudodesulfovibrio mercurii TaxID=641491 RepID=F0JC09_9BACT|nr:hypothetical protein [Pseudodesulfovibrio mercurii]EGB15582.1 hypothetical protein DND132_2379 [Pseudodesulfovibrio mercurii]